jgi:hypothetical protein
MSSTKAISRRNKIQLQIRTSPSTEVACREGSGLGKAAQKIRSWSAPLRPPLPRRLTLVRMDAQACRLRFAFQHNIIVAISREGPSHSGAYHCGLDIDAISVA